MLSGKKKIMKIMQSSISICPCRRYIKKQILGLLPRLTPATRRRLKKVKPVEDIVTITNPVSIVAARGQESEIRGQDSEVRGQESEVRGQDSEVRGQESEVRGLELELREQGIELRAQEFALRGRLLGPMRQEFPDRMQALEVRALEFWPRGQRLVEPPQLGEVSMFGRLQDVEEEGQEERGREEPSQALVRPRSNSEVWRGAREWGALSGGAVGGLGRGRRGAVGGVLHRGKVEAVGGVNIGNGGAVGGVNIGIGGAVGRRGAQEQMRSTGARVHRVGGGAVGAVNKG